jgi:transposase
MEATGNYHINLANYLYQAGIKVVAENPLKIKRFSQMSLKNEVFLTTLITSIL